MIEQARSRLALVLALALAPAGIACGSKEATPGAAADAQPEIAIDEDDTAEAGLPPLDPAACPKVSGDEAPLSFSRDYALLSSGSIEQDKAFYLATVLEVPAVQVAVAGDATLVAIAKDRDARFRDAAATCSGDGACILTLTAWSDAEAKAAADVLVSRLQSSGMLATVVTKHLRVSGMFNLHAGDTDDVLLHDAFVELVLASSGAISSYAGEVAPAKLDLAMKDAVATHASTPALHRAALLTALVTMKAAGRDEAMRYEPMATGHNAKALARIPSIDFGSFPFVAIVVPGLGPNNLDAPLSEGGRERADLAADRWLAKVAPLIVLSGGHVHPDRTPYSEAIEMKKYLMEMRAIPENALLVDPHARHTTTNLRNVSRLFFRYGVPVDRPALVTTDLGQTLYMQTTGFPLRNDKELGYRPWRVLAQLSSNDTCFVPTRLSLHADGRDPLDP